MAQTVAKELGKAAEYEVAFSVDLIFATERADEPGSMRLEVLSPKRGSVLSAVVTITSGASIMGNIESIAKVLQKEVFNRLGLDVLNPSDATLYFCADGHADPGLADGHYLKAACCDGKFSFEKTDEVFS
ncbi:MAG: hypothetical protein LBJ10_03690 [Clostridiales bacterium]|jgi:hypothetical protein|nr:hypothetical protein [Clostridiales bacterium]